MSQSPGSLAREVLDACRSGEKPPNAVWRQLLRQTSEEAGSLALFRDLVEPLSDSFEPSYCARYAELLSEAIEHALPQFNAGRLRERYERIRPPKKYAGNAASVRDVYVLSRVTLGADVAVTSVMLDAAKKRFPNATIHFAGSSKAYELFSADPRISHLEVGYSRGGTLRQKLEAGLELRDKLKPRGVVIDPDSRLTQLGLLPVCEEEDYFFFESRSFGADGKEPLGALARRWVEGVFGVEAESFLAPECEPATKDPDLVCVSLGVGENPAKRIADPFEAELIRHLVRAGLELLVDQGAGREESERVLRAIAQCGARSGQVRTFQGAFAPFAAAIARARMYVGYDSSGQHVAACCGVPLVTIFAGHVSERMFARWHPFGRGLMEVVKVEDPAPGAVLERAKAALERIMGASR
ncbi:MAG: glycosyltransferase family 9 protein [Acidimicrobiia bacterium]|nr:glycosyltransferase family 9 protein [Acidimicrobiia bacterium]